MIVTDGDIEYPSEEMPYRVLWVLPARGSFCPRYGVVISMEGEPAMKAVQELVTYFDRRGKLSARQIRKLLDGGFLAADAPTNMVDLGDDIGATFYFRVCGKHRWAGLGHGYLCRRLGAGDCRRACRPGQAR